MIRMTLILVFMILTASISAAEPATNSGNSGSQAVTKPTPTVTTGPPAIPNEKPASKISFLDDFFSYWQQGGTNTSRSDIARNFLLALAAFIGLFFGIWRAWTAHTQANASVRQAETAAQVHVTGRFTAAVEQLGNKQLPVRMGGIYALWRLAEDSPEHHTTNVIDILCAFARNPPHGPATPLQWKTETKSEAIEKQNEVEAPKLIPRLRSDVQAILTLVGDNKAKYRHHLSNNYRLNFQSADLSLGNLREASLIATDLGGSILFAAQLSDADLSGANLIRANLEGANLRRANLGHADLKGANLYGANLDGAKLNGADITATRFIGAKNLTQDQINAACVLKGGTPPLLAPDLRPPTNTCPEN